MDPLTLILALVLVVEVPVSMIAAWRLSRRYRVRLVESLFFRRLVRRNIRVAWIAGGLIGLLVFYGLISWTFGLPPIPRPWGTVLLALALIVLLYGPIDDELAVRRIARSPSPEVDER